MHLENCHTKYTSIKLLAIHTIEDILIPLFQEGKKEDGICNETAAQTLSKGSEEFERFLQLGY